jgi:hypothetical protein
VSLFPRHRRIGKRLIARCRADKCRIGRSLRSSERRRGGGCCFATHECRVGQGRVDAERDVRGKRRLPEIGERIEQLRHRGDLGKALRTALQMVRDILGGLHTAHSAILPPLRGRREFLVR